MNVFIKEQVLDKSYLEYLVIRKSFEERCTECGYDAYNKCLSIHLFEYSRFFDKSNQLEKVEALCPFFHELIESYWECIAILDNDKLVINNEHMRAIYKGITEMLSNQIEKLGVDLESQIEVERLSIKSEAIAEVKAVIKKKLIKNNEIGFSLIITNQTVYDIIEEFILAIFEAAIDDIAAIEEGSINRLTNLTQREKLNQAYQLLLEQKESLEVLFNIENDIIEDALVDEESHEITNTLNAVINKIQTHLNDKISEIEPLIQNDYHYTLNKEREYKNISTIVQTLKENEEFSNKMMVIVDDYCKGKHKLRKKLYSTTIDEINKAISFSTKEISNDSMETQLLSFQIVETLKGLLDELETLKDLDVQEEYLLILKGINQTLNLKFESLKEKNDEYILAKKEKLVIYEKKMIDFLDKVKEQFKAYFDCLIGGSKEELLSTHKKFIKLVNQIKDDNNKQDIAYLKQDLLFEIVTFEEIIRYSLPKLENSGNKEIQRALDSIMAAYKQIEKTLVKSDVQLICPEPHDRFNGIEYEVLVAEETEGFAKGEIISLYTKGYRYKNKVIIRASVNVAK